LRIAAASAYDVASVSAPAKARSVTRIASVGAEADALAQRFLRLRRAHAQHRHAAAELVLQAQRLFEREQVVRVDDRRHALAHDGVGDRVHADLRGVRHLLDADDDVHGGRASLGRSGGAPSRASCRAG
jgi:hypothetical protein